jgi:hypothetical protein
MKSKKVIHVSDMKNIHPFRGWVIIAVSCLLISGCAMDRIFLNPEPIITVAPDVELDPNLTTPLAALLTLTTDVPTRINLEISTSKKSWTVDLEKLEQHPCAGSTARHDTFH